MKIICDKNRLSDSIQIVSKAVSGKSTLPILECIYVGSDNGSLKMIANDLQLAIEVSNIEAEIVEEGCVALSARLFSDIIRKLPDGQVTINTDIRFVTVISSGKSEFKILGLNGAEFPFLTSVERSSPYMLPSLAFREMIRHTLFSVSADDTRQVMTGELLKFEDGKVEMASSDGFRISVSTASADNVLKDKKVVIPAKALSEISKIISAEKDVMLYVYFSDRHALFEQGNFKVVTRLIEGDFINYENIFKNNPTTRLTVDREFLSNALERSMLISTEQKKNPVKLNMKDGYLIITSIAETGTVYDEMNVIIDGNDLEIGFNPRFLADVLRVMDDINVVIEFTTALSQCIIKGHANDKYRFVVLPLRLKN